MWKAGSPMERDTPRPYLVFGLHGSRYAVEASAVREIVRLPELTPIGETPDYVAGVVNLRGKIVPVLDLNRRFGYPPQRYRLEDSVVVLESDEGLSGLIVNQVYAVRELSEADVEAVPALGPQAEPGARFLAGITRSEEQVVMLLDRASVLLLPETLSETEPRGAQPGSGTAPSFCPDATPQERAVFQERARELARPLSGQDLAGGAPLAVVRMCGELFGIDLKVVREFAELRGVTPVPCCPGHILGQMNLRGELFTLVDLGAVLGLPPAAAAPAAERGRKVVVLDLPDLGVAVPVEEVLDVRYFQPEEIAPLPAAVRTVSAAFLRGTAPHGARMLSILDLPRIFSQERLGVNEEP